MGDEGWKSVATTFSKPSKIADANVRAEAADQAVAVILSSYPPDLAKGAREYAKQLMRHIEQYPIAAINRLADPISGIVTRCKFPPTIADIVEFVKSTSYVNEPRGIGPNFTRERLEREARQGTRPTIEDRSRGWRCPFPRLAEAFPDRDLRLPFDVLNASSRALATQGKEAAAALMFGEVAKSAGPIAPEIEAPVL